MGAAFFCQIAPSIHPRPCKTRPPIFSPGSSYLQNNPKWVLKASKQARVAVEYVMTGKLPEGRRRAAAAA